MNALESSRATPVLLMVWVAIILSAVLLVGCGTTERYQPMGEGLSDGLKRMGL